MAPPFLSPDAKGTLPVYMQPYLSASRTEQQQQQQPQQQEPTRYMRHDSPIELRKPAQHPSLNPSIDTPGYDLPYSGASLQDLGCFEAQSSKQQLRSSLQPPTFSGTQTPMDSNNNTDDEAATSAGDFQFVTVDHPGKLKDKTQMRANRQFVMQNYLRKESRKSVGPRDARSASYKRQRLDPDAMERPAVTRNESAPGFIFDPSHLTPASSVHSATSLQGDEEGEPVAWAATSEPVLRLPQRPNSTSAMNSVAQWPDLGDSQDAFLSSLATNEEHSSSAQPSAPSVQVASTMDAESTQNMNHSTPRPGQISNEATLDVPVSQHTTSSEPALINQSIMRIMSEDLGNRSGAPTASTELIQRSGSSAAENSYLSNSMPEPGRARMNTFNTWPRFSNPRLVVEKLKYECNKHFGSQAMGVNWVPMIIRAPHAFLSTICIYGGYGESFHGNGGAGINLGRRSTEKERMQIENEVIGMINRCLSSPLHRISDATLIAVLHLLNSAIMTSTPQVQHLHAVGLTKMVGMRGGLDKLGARGEIATIVTSTVLLIAVLGEVAPPTIYADYVRSRDLRPPTQTRERWPQSPLFCGPTFGTDHGKAGYILACVRQLVECFKADMGQLERQKIAHIGSQIAAFESLAPQDPVFATGEEAKYEAIRLTARLFAEALITRNSFSLTAQRASARTSSVSPVIPITHALRRTNLDDCWGMQAGVLLWVVLTAGAAAPVTTAADSGEMLGLGEAPEEERARRWLAAVAVRCVILLAFDYGEAVLGTLARMAEVQRMLARRAGEAGGRVGTARRDAEVGAAADEPFGPLQSLG